MPSENSFLSSLSLLIKNIEEEIHLSNDQVHTTRGWTLKQVQELVQVNHVSMDCNLY